MSLCIRAFGKFFVQPAPCPPNFSENCPRFLVNRFICARLWLPSAANSLNGSNGNGHEVVNGSALHGYARNCHPINGETVNKDFTNGYQWCPSQMGFERGEWLQACCPKRVDAQRDCYKRPSYQCCNSQWGFYELPSPYQYGSQWHG